MAEEKKVRNSCNTCKRKTWHDIEGIHSVTHTDDYHCSEHHILLKCRGCETVSFQYAIDRYEDAYPEYDGEWHVPRDVEVYPKPNKVRLKTFPLPEIVEAIYVESCNVYRDGSLLLAGIGFRATIEAICNDQNIKGKELSTRINNLATQGLISKKDSKRLHSIRFLGNDAAHDLKIPSKKNLEAALTIVEHLLTTVYILDYESKDKLEQLIEEFEVFTDLLEKKIENYNTGDEYPLQMYFGRDMRLLSGSFKQLEDKLKKAIGKGEFTKLSFGKNSVFQESKDKFQHYIVT
jgi:hypothetical protein